MRAHILDGDKVQIGNTVFHTTSGRTEKAQANRPGLNDESIACVYVPGKSIEFARIAREQGPRGIKRID